ncbi:unnamed protein product [Urochloa humidicola]
MGDGQIRTSDRDERMICHIVNTAVYYQQTVEDLQRQLEPATKEQEALIDIFLKERNHHVKIFGNKYFTVYYHGGSAMGQGFSSRLGRVSMKASVARTQ